ncbi:MULTISPECIES: superoxide dismutase [Bradyrhizobium]|uniref:superoxide dismutase n=1 Tax=Bradyrhizobium TaxID=374 RepID=UPI0004264272|nr:MULTISPECIES: superoxide dismutase [Bradyrhizobium]KIU43126.1 superoxide dismutase [Bradyrhizobium elkanii]MBK5653587.1 superoxide dismutase [Rhizobium sp.]
MFQLPTLPYPIDALAPYMSAQTLEFHHGRHHKAYVDKLNELTAAGRYDGMDLEAIIRTSAQNPADRTIFNQAGQHWNHSHFWLGMKKNGGGPIPGNLEKRVIADFGSVEKFKDDFKSACIAQFGSGWAWLVFDGEKLAVTKTGNADTPLTEGHAALLTCDVWEHSYYIDYHNLRPKYVDAFLSNLVDWETVTARFERAIKAS